MKHVTKTQLLGGLAFVAVVGISGGWWINQSTNRPEPKPSPPSPERVTQSHSGDGRAIVYKDESVEMAIDRVLKATNGQEPPTPLLRMDDQRFANGATEPSRLVSSQVLTVHKAHPLDERNKWKQTVMTANGPLDVVTIFSQADHATGWALPAGGWAGGKIAENQENSLEFPSDDPVQNKWMTSTGPFRFQKVKVAPRRVMTLDDSGWRGLGVGKMLNGMTRTVTTDTILVPMDMKMDGYLFGSRGTSPKALFIERKGITKFNCAAQSSTEIEESPSSVFGKMGVIAADGSNVFTADGPANVGGELFPDNPIDWRLNQSSFRMGQDGRLTEKTSKISSVTFSLHIDFTNKRWSRSTTANPGFPADIDGNGQIWESIVSGSDNFTCFNLMKTPRFHGMRFECLDGFDLASSQYRRMDVGPIYLRKGERGSIIQPTRAADDYVTEPFEVTRIVGSCQKDGGS